MWCDNHSPYFIFYIKKITSMPKKYKYHRIDVLVPGGTGAGTTSKVFSLDKNYDTIEGVQAIMSVNGGIPTFNVGFSDTSKDFIDLVDYKMLDNTRVGVKPEDQFFVINERIQTGEYSIKTNFDTVLVTNIKYQFILKLSKEI